MRESYVDVAKHSRRVWAVMTLLVIIDLVFLISIS